MSSEEELKKAAFENPAVLAALKSMTPEQREHYKKIGEEMYGTIDFADNKILDNMAFVEEAVLYISEALKSGLNPKDLSEDEKNFMVNMHGDKWYEKFGWTEEHVNMSMFD